MNKYTRSHQSAQEAPHDPADPTGIRRTLAMFFDAGQVTELRALDVSTPRYRRPHTVSGYFDDFDTLATEAAKVSAYAKGCVHGIWQRFAGKWATCDAGQKAL
jgi:hypothetical protein